MTRGQDLRTSLGADRFGTGSGTARRGYREAGKGALFDRFKQLLAGEPDHLLQAQIATELGMSENGVKQAYHRFRQRYRELLHDEIAHTVA